MPETLEVEALDVSESAWEDALGELLTENPDAITPMFLGGAENPDIFPGSCNCDCTDCLGCGGCGNCFS